MSVSRGKSDKAKLKLKCDKLAKEIVKLRDDYTCQHCGMRVEGGNCQASHVIPVSYGHRFAYDTRNMKVLCMHCHLHWWHKNPIEAAEWYKKKFPANYKYLEKRKKETIVPLTEQYFRDIYDRLLEEEKLYD